MPYRFVHIQFRRWMDETSERWNRRCSGPKPGPPRRRSVKVRCTQFAALRLQFGCKHDSFGPHPAHCGTAARTIAGPPIPARTSTTAGAQVGGTVAAPAARRPASVWHRSQVMAVTTIDCISGISDIQGTGRRSERAGAARSATDRDVRPEFEWAMRVVRGPWLRGVHRSGHGCSRRAADDSPVGARPRPDTPRDGTGSRATGRRRVRRPSTERRRINEATRR